MIRGPLQTLLYIPVLWVTGEKLIPLRLLTLLFILTGILLFANLGRARLAAALSVPILLIQFHFFHFSHYAMAEIMIIALCIASLALMIQYSIKGKIKYALLAASLIFLAYSLKIQYVYLAAILPGAALVKALLSLKNPLVRKKNFRSFGVISALTLAFVLLYLLAWYLPNKEFYDYVMLRETGQRIVFERGELINTITFTYKHFIQLPETRIIRYVFLISLILLPFSYRNLKAEERELLLILAIWILLECHKLFMPHYLPVRYLLSALAAIGLFSCIVLSGLLRLPYLRYGIAGVIVFIALVHFFDYHDSYRRRTYDLKAVNTWVKSHDLKGKTLMGNWAASCSWETGAITLPVWNNFLNHENIVETHKPVLIFSETNESDSDEAFRDNGIDLNYGYKQTLFRIWRYDVGVYEMDGVTEAKN